MASSAYTIKQEQYEKNIKLVYEYERERNMNHTEFARICGINYNTFAQIASGRFSGTIFTWRKIKAATNLKIEYDQKICDCLPPKLSKNEIFLTDDVIPHIAKFGNVYMNPMRVKQLGGNKKLIDTLKAYGLNCRIHPESEDDGFILEVCFNK